VRGGRERALELFGAHDIEEDGVAPHALPEDAAIELEAALIGIPAQDLPERGVDEITVAQEDRVEPRFQPREETHQSA